MFFLSVSASDWILHALGQCEFHLNKGGAVWIAFGDDLYTVRRVRILAFVVYLPLQLVLLPLLLPAVLIFSYYQIVVSRRLGVSQTGIEVLGGRVHMHLFGLREDEDTMALAAVLPNFALRLTRFLLFPQMVHQWIAGKSILYPLAVVPGKEGIGQMITARTVFLDGILDRSVPGVNQLVFLGAGYDTRAYSRMRRNGLRIFEVDLPATQELKIQSLDQAGIDREQVTFVQTDFAKDDLFERLAAAGYEPGQPTVFIWEGVTLYLSETDVRETLALIRARAGQGSVIACDFYSDRLVAIGKKGPTKEVLKVTDETFGFSLPMDRDWESELAKFVGATGWACRTSHFLGSDSPKGPYMAVVELRPRAETA